MTIITRVNLVCPFAYLAIFFRVEFYLARMTGMYHTTHNHVKVFNDKMFIGAVGECGCERDSLLLFFASWFPSVSLLFTTLVLDDDRSH